MTTEPPVIHDCPICGPWCGTCAYIGPCGHGREYCADHWTSCVECAAEWADTEAVDAVSDGRWS